MPGSTRKTFQILASGGAQKIIINSEPSDATTVRLGATAFGLDGTGSTLDFKASQYAQDESASNVVVSVGGTLTLTPANPQATIDDALLTADHLLVNFAGDATTGTITVVVTYVG